MFVRLSLLKVWGLKFQSVLSYSIDLVYCHTFRQKQHNQPRLILIMPEKPYSRHCPGYEGCETYLREVRYSGTENPNKDLITQIQQMR